VLHRLRQLLSPEPDLTWIGSESEAIEFPVTPQPQRRQRPKLHVELNAELVLGALIVLGLFAVVLFGPLMAPANPYLAGQSSSMIIDGQFTTAPFAPMPGLPLGSDQWGRDILSMLLYGTRNTLVACLFIAMARVLLGSTLGMVAGWNEGGMADRLVMSLIEVTTALPALLVGMILIFALGIQGGITVFIIALCFVGWSEIAQFVRSEFMVIRRKPFIEGARVVGLNGLGIAVRHILPNVLPSLVIIAVLEMGAVLMILGELGFIGVFIGGGTWIQVGDTEVANIPDIPEWGAMMAGARQFARSKTWMVFYPALAFFLAVLGFNLLGEGLRRIVQRRGVRTSFILSRRMVAAIAVVTLATAYIITHVGPAPSYASLAQRFDSDQALAHVQMLTTGAMEQRQVDTAGADRAAAYIAERFRQYGLETLRPNLGFRLPFTVQLVDLEEQPELAITSAEGQALQSFIHRVDFGASIEGHGGTGETTAPLAVCTFFRLSFQPHDFEGLDLRGHVVMYLNDNAPPGFAVEAQIRGATGILVVDDDFAPRLTVADEDRDYLRRPVLPVFRINPSTADVLLAPSGLAVSALVREIDQTDASDPGWAVKHLSQMVRMRVQLSPVHSVQAENVLGVWEGSDAQLNKELVVVSSHYDNPGRQPDGSLFTAANDGASGVGVMLEILRLWNTSGFQPRRTVYFAAWAGGDWENSGAHEYLRNQAVYSVLDLVAVMNLDGLGRGGPDLAVRGDSALIDLVQRAGDSSGVTVKQGLIHDRPYYHAFDGPAVTVAWSDDRTPPTEDTVNTLSEAQLGSAGQTLNLALITLAREYAY
jgi:ABC-type dipeptide/oligopeptide/nickel transport system permease subunit